MTKKHFIFSTLTCDQEYTGYREGGGDLPIVDRAVTIKGGANVTNKRGDIPAGVVTEVDDGELEFLQGNAVFKIHVENGFLLVSASKPDVEVAAADMTTRSPDAPLEALDFDGSAGAKPMAGSVGAEPAPRTNSRRA